VDAVTERAWEILAGLLALGALAAGVIVHACQR